MDRAGLDPAHHAGAVRRASLWFHRRAVELPLGGVHHLKRRISYSEADFTEPTYTTSSCSNDADITWAGIGGGPNAVNGSSLLQTGTTHGTNLSNHQPFWENFPTTTGQPFPQSGSASPGNAITGVVDTQAQPGSVVFSVYDETTGQSWTTTKKLSSKPNPATAEMITERPKMGKTYPELSNFGTLGFVSDEAAQGGLEHGLNTFSTQAINMTQDGSSSALSLTTPGALDTSSGSGFNAAAVSKAISYGSVDTTKLLRRGIDIERPRPTNALQTLTVADVMQPVLRSNGAAAEHPPSTRRSDRPTRTETRWESLAGSPTVIHEPQEVFGADDPDSAAGSRRSRGPPGLWSSPSPRAASSPRRCATPF